MPETPRRSRKRRRPVRLPPGPRKGRGAGSTMVGQRIESARALTSSIRHYRSKVQAGLAARLASELRPGEAVPDQGLILELAGRSVESALAALASAHRRYERQTALCHNLSLECDRLAAEELYPRAVDLRRFLDAAFGKRQGTLIHGFQGRIPTSREGLRQQIGRTLLFLEDPRVEIPEPRVPERIGDREAWSRLIRPAFEELDERLDALARQNLEREMLGVARRRAMKTFDAVLRDARTLSEAAFRLAGLGERPRKELRAGYERRWLSRWARDRRARRLEASAAAAGGAGTARERGRAPDRSPLASLWSAVSERLSGCLRFAPLRRRTRR